MSLDCDGVEAQLQEVASLAALTLASRGSSGTRILGLRRSPQLRRSTRE